MATDNHAAANPPAAALFQKAHGRIVMLQRIDEQLSGLAEQRRKVQEELREVQEEINQEFARVMRAAEEAPPKILAQFSDWNRAGGRIEAAA
jgi:predicted  nucleic acid-binding Zn-ribbon protein